MIWKFALIPSLLHLCATIVLLVFSFKILSHKENEKNGLVVLSLISGNTRRDLLGEATALGGVVSTLAPEVTSAAGVAASRVTDAVSSVVSNAASLETSVVDQIFATNYTVGTKYACAASSCDQIPSLEVVLCFGLAATLISATTSALMFFLPFMKPFTLGCSTLALLFFIVFTACVVSVVEIASLVADSTFFRVQRGDVFAESLWTLGSAIVLFFSAFGMLFAG
ncbi:hypothetical protein NKR23_g12308 [Pleurostoma richardsiae]|uniref:Uncharacterized protein n=1 Tax=Pleurostoma richardsiae TaxID=41990 RepID=A0AA38R8A1_9PEZI|nr:hypothetical protein NKR23_g12308 [Pleurostoma richardsiae]